jgi:DNA-binding response OmpR family regulator
VNLHPQEPTQPGEVRPGRASAGTAALIVSSRGLWRRRTATALRRAGMSCASVTTIGEACAVLAAAEGGGDSAQSSPSRLRVGVVLVDAILPDGDGLSLVEPARRAGAATVLAVEGVTIDGAVRGLRAGLADLVTQDTPADEVARRTAAAARRGAGVGSGRSSRLFGLGGLCRSELPPEPRLRLRREPQPVERPDGGFVKEDAGHMNQITTASEFKGLIRQELDIENLLRTTLEFVLARSGPTNAAVFLPTTSGDYSLGAYVNYDCPKDTCDVLLDHLANSVAPKFEALRSVLHVTTRAELDKYIDGEAAWLGDSHVVAYCCKHEGETLAIFMLFRDRRSPFAPGVLDQVQTIGELFAAQLARVIHIHHRHLPKHKWGMLGDPETEAGGDDYGLAA